mmetsp:Transcript_2865/g.6957  ORF Transcript_2865/g.6957 Transcript_2865/m.6957 type:complete len:239 (+) Transcript_2865:193-909(+)
MASSNASPSHDPVTTTCVASPSVTMCAMVTPPSDAPSSADVGSSSSVGIEVEADDEAGEETRVTEHAETKSRMATPACARAAEAAATVAGSSAPPASITVAYTSTLVFGNVSAMTAPSSARSTRVLNSRSASPWPALPRAPGVAKVASLTSTSSRPCSLVAPPAALPPPCRGPYTAHITLVLSNSTYADPAAWLITPVLMNIERISSAWRPPSLITGIVGKVKGSGLFRGCLHAASVP